MEILLCEVMTSLKIQCYRGICMIGSHENYSTVLYTLSNPKQKWNPKGYIWLEGITSTPWDIALDYWILTLKFIFMLGMEWPSWFLSVQLGK